MSEEEIVLTEMPTEEILELMGEDLYDGYAEEVVEEVNECLSRGMTPYDLLTNGLVAGMDIVGGDFRDGVLFVPEVLMAANAMKGGMAILRPLLAETGAGGGANGGTSRTGMVETASMDFWQKRVAVQISAYLPRT